MSHGQPLDEHDEQQILPEPEMAAGQAQAILSLRRAFDEARAAHIAIDLQRCYCEPGHSYNKHFSPLAARAAALAEPVSTLADTMREHGLRTIWVAHAFKGALDGQPEEKPEAYRDRSRMARRELYGVRRDIGDAVLCKDHFDAFKDTQLDRILKKRGITTLLLTGAFFDQCVRATATGAKERGYEVAVVRDLSIPAYEDVERCLSDYRKDGIRMLRMQDELGILK